MVDTMVINLPLNHFTIQPSYFDRFTPSARGLLVPPYTPFGGQRILKAVCNPTAEDKKSGLYFPRLTLIRAIRAGGPTTFLRIEFSAPKIIYANNVDEIAEAELDLLIQTLEQRLRHFGVVVSSPDVLRQAEVASIHYCKNIVLTDYRTPTQIIHQVSKVDISLWQDINNSDYRNTGYAFKLHSNDYEFIVYDKLKDLLQAKKSDKKAISRDNDCQLDLFTNQPTIRPFEVLRLEARYNTKTRITAKLGKAGIDALPKLTVEQLFKQSVAQKALRLEIGQLRDKYQPLLAHDSPNYADLYTNLTIANPNASHRDKLEAIGRLVLQQETGSRDIRNLGNVSPQEWHRSNKRIDSLKVDQDLDKNPFPFIEQALAEFTQTKLQNYLANPQPMIYNDKDNKPSYVNHLLHH